MSSWNFRWNFDMPSYSPGQTMTFSLWIDNTNDTYIHVSEFFLIFDFGEYALQTVSGMIAPKKTMYVGNIKRILPQNVIGNKIFSFRYKMQEYVNDAWQNLGEYNTPANRFVSVFPSPFYNIFLSRGLTVPDRALGDPIAEMIREWALTTTTVGIDIHVPEAEVAEAVRREVLKADGMIVVATPRTLDSLTGLWRTLEWAHDELSIAYGDDKPLLIVKDKSVTLGGLPSYLTSHNRVPQIEFDPYNMHELKLKLTALMPSYRAWIETKRKQEFNENLKSLAVKGLAVIGGIALLSGIVGALSGSSDD